MIRHPEALGRRSSARSDASAARGPSRPALRAGSLRMTGALACRRVNMSNSIPVLIVGGGPVGLALAGDLGWRGVRVPADRAVGRLDLPAAPGPRRHPHHGVLPPLGPRRGGRSLALSARLAAGQRLCDEPHRLRARARALPRRWATQKPPPASPQKRERCPQNMFDPILRAFASSHAESSSCAIARASSASSRTTTASSPASKTSTARGATTSRRSTSPGCDGARSLVRETLGIGMTGNPALTYTTNIIFRCPHLAVAARQGAWPIASSSSGPRACGPPSWRSTAAISGACRSSAAPSRAS